jgi:tripartite motif-containing protein 71
MISVQGAYDDFSINEIRFNSLAAATTDERNAIFLVDRNNHRIVKLDDQGNFLSQFGTLGNSEGELCYPTKIALDKNGNIFIVNDYKEIHKFSNSGEFILKWGKGIGASNFEFIRGTCFDSTGNIWVCDFLLKQIIQFDTNGNHLNEWILDSSPLDIKYENGFIYVLCEKAPHLLKGLINGTIVPNWNPLLEDMDIQKPEAFTIDGKGNIYLVDSRTRIQKINSDGILLWTWSAPIEKYQGVFDLHYSDNKLLVSTSSTLFILDENANQIKRIGDGEKMGQLVYPQKVRFYNDRIFVLAKNCIHIFTQTWKHILSWGKEGIEVGEFMHANGIDLDSYGNLYIADRGNNRIQKFSKEGEFLISWDIGRVEVEEDPLDPNNSFRTPLDLTVTEDDIVCVIDLKENCVQQFDVNGKLLNSWVVQCEYKVNTYFLPFRPRIIKAFKNLLYLSNRENVIVALDFSGNIIYQWQPTEMKLKSIKDFYIDSKNNIFITNDHQVLKFDREGNLLNEFGKEGIAYGRFNNPSGIEMQNSILYICDTYNHRIQFFSVTL